MGVAGNKDVNIKLPLHLHNDTHTREQEMVPSMRPIPSTKADCSDRWSASKTAAYHREAVVVSPGHDLVAVAKPYSEGADRHNLLFRIVPLRGNGREGRAITDG